MCSVKKSQLNDFRGVIAFTCRHHQLHSRAASSELGTYRLCEQRRFRRAFRQKARYLAPLNGWACAVKVCYDGMLEDTNSLDAAQLLQGICCYKVWWLRNIINHVPYQECDVLLYAILNLWFRMFWFYSTDTMVYVHDHVIKFFVIQLLWRADLFTRGRYYCPRAKPEGNITCRGWTNPHVTLTHGQHLFYYIDVF